MRIWGSAIIVLPVAVIASTLILTTMQMGWGDVGDVSWLRVVLELSLATALVWVWTRQHWPASHWRAWVVACVEGWTLLAVALCVAMVVGVLAIQINQSWWAVFPALAVAGPLAGWCMAEEVVLRIMLPVQMPWQDVRRVRLLQWVIATAVVWLMSTPTSWYALIVIAAGELLGVVTAHCSGDFTTMWARRWAWRWMMIALLGATQLGIVLALPSLFTMVMTEALVPAMVTAGVLVTWSFTIFWWHANEPVPPLQLP